METGPVSKYHLSVFDVDRNLWAWSEGVYITGRIINSDLATHDRGGAEASCFAQRDTSGAGGFVIL